MVEKRASLRVNPPEGSLAINQMNRSQIGRIIDISTTGFLLAGREKINSGMIFQLELLIVGQKNAQINVGAECVWVDLQTSGLSIAGFHVIDISDQDNHNLASVIEQLTER